MLVGEEAGIGEVGERVYSDGMVAQGLVVKQGIWFLCLSVAEQQQGHKYENKCLFHGGEI